MKKIYKVIIIILSITTLPVKAFEESNQVSLPEYITSDYKLVWQDEFDGKTLSDWWSKQNCDSEEDYFAEVHDGSLHLKGCAVATNKGIWDQYRKNDQADAHYEQNLSFRYGYIEAKIKNKFGDTSFPSFWLKGNTNLTERKIQGAHMELDIMEGDKYLDNIDAGKHTTTLHKHHEIQKWSIQRAWNKQVISDYFGDEPQWHTYALQWTPDGYTVYTDGLVTATEKFIDSNLPEVDKTLPLNLQGWNFAKDPVYIILSQWFKGADTPSQRPYIMEVDYVRLYQSDNVEDSALWTSAKLETKKIPDGEVGKAYETKIEANAIPVNSLVYSSDGLPDGLQLNNKTGEITGTPTKSGNYKIKIIVSNSNFTGQTDEEKEYTISIKGNDVKNINIAQIVNVPATSAYGSIIILILGIISIVVAITLTKKITKK